MSGDAFQTLRVLSQQVIDFAAPVPATQELIQNWHGAAFDVLGTRCVISADETRMIVDLGDTIPLPGVKHWVRGLANVGGRQPSRDLLALGVRMLEAVGRRDAGLSVR